MKTSTRRIGISTVLALVLCINTMAQDITPDKPAFNRVRLSVGPDFGLPIGNFAGSYSWIFGGSVQADIPIFPGIFITATAGYKDAFVKNNEGTDFPGRNLQLIPVKAGLKYYVLSNLLYVQGQAGVTFLGNKSDAFADRSSGFTWSPQLGTSLKLTRTTYIDAGFYFEQTHSYWNTRTNLSMLGLRLAYSFGL